MDKMTFERAVHLAEHLIAIGTTTVYLDSTDPGLPWASATDVLEGGLYRLDSPAAVWIVAEAHASGLTFRWSVEFEKCDANGRGVLMFDRDRLREVTRRLPPSVRSKFASLLEAQVLPGATRRAAEIRVNLAAHEDSVDCVRGLIAFAKEGA